MTDKDKELERLTFELRRATKERDDRGVVIERIRARVERLRGILAQERTALADMRAKMDQAVAILE